MKHEPKSEARFAVCINNQGYEASLEVGKLYRILPDDAAGSHGYLSVIDESGEGYGYAADRFFPLEVPSTLEDLLAAACPSPQRPL